MKRIFLAFVFALFFLSITPGMEVLAQDQFTRNEGELFPTWGQDVVPGVIGNTGDGKFLVQYVPRIIDVFLKFIAPTAFVVLLIAGLRMIISGDNSEEVEKGKKIVIYTFIGVVLIVISYSLTKALYFIFADTPPTAFIITKLLA